MGTKLKWGTISQTAHHVRSMRSVVTTACVKVLTQLTVVESLAVACLVWSISVYMELSERKGTSVQQTIGTKPAASSSHSLESC